MSSSTVVSRSTSQLRYFLLQSVAIASAYTTYYIYNRHNYNQFERKLRESGEPRYENGAMNYASPLDEIPESTLSGLLGTDVVSKEQFRLFMQSGYLKVLMHGILKDLTNCEKYLEEDFLRAHQHDLNRLNHRLRVLSVYLGSQERKHHDEQFVMEYNHLVQHSLRAISTMHRLENYNATEMKRLLLVMMKDQSLHRCLTKENAHRILFHFLPQPIMEQRKSEVVRTAADDSQNVTIVNSTDKELNASPAERKKRRAALASPENLRAQRRAGLFLKQLLETMQDTQNTEYEHLFEMYPEMLPLLKERLRQLSEPELLDYVEQHNPVETHIPDTRIKSSEVYIQSTLMVTYVTYAATAIYIASRLRGMRYSLAQSGIRAFTGGLLIAGASIQENVVRDHWKRSDSFFPFLKGTFCQMDEISFLLTVSMVWLAFSLCHFAFVSLVTQMFLPPQLGLQLAMRNARESDSNDTI